MFLECSNVRSEAVILEANYIHQTCRDGVDSNAFAGIGRKRWNERVLPRHLGRRDGFVVGESMPAAAELIRTMLPPSVRRRMAARVTENAVVKFQRMVSSYSG